MNGADGVVGSYLSAADERLPGLITGVYGYGSLVLEDYRPGTSDVDLLLVTARELSPGDLAALEKIHTSMPATPLLEAIYVPAAWLERSPLPEDPRLVPYWLDATMHPGGEYGPLNPVVWLQVTRHGRIFRGGPLAVTADPARVRAYNLDNLKTYWQRNFAERIPVRFAGVDPATEFAPDMATWVVLGPPRLHYTLATGDVTSKSGAGRYLAEHFPAYADLAGRAVAARAGEPAAFTVADAFLAAEMIDTLTTDAWQRWS